MHTRFYECRCVVAHASPVTVSAESEEGRFLPTTICCDMVMMSIKHVCEEFRELRHTNPLHTVDTKPQIRRIETESEALVAGSAPGRLARMLGGCDV